MCIKIETSQFIPALINCTAEATGRDSFSIPNCVLWATIKEVQMRCWSNIEISNASIDTLILFLQKNIAKDFITRNNQEIKINHISGEIKTRMSNYFYSDNTIWYQNLREICTNNISYQNESLIYDSNPRPDNIKTPPNTQAALDLLYPDRVLVSI